MCTAGEQCVNGVCKPDTNATCPAGEHHNGSQCVSGDAPECPPNKEYIVGKCVLRCHAGQIRQGTKCVPDRNAECPEGQHHNGTRCVEETPPSQVGILGGLVAGVAGGTLTDTTTMSLTAGLTAAQAAATNAVFNKMTSSYNASNIIMEKRQQDLDMQIEDFSISVPSDGTRDSIIDAQLEKPVAGSTAKIRIWGVIPASDIP